AASGFPLPLSLSLQYSESRGRRPASLPNENFCMTEKLKSAPLAYRNQAFLNSPDGRILRILSEYQEPLSRFRREQIQDTVVFFGSARFHPHEDASAQLAELRAA